MPSYSSRVCVSSGHSFRAWLPLHVSVKLTLCLLFTKSPGVDLRSRRRCWRLYRWLHCSELPLTPTPFSPTEQVLVLGLNRTQASCPKTPAALADGVDARPPSGFSRKRLCDGATVKPGGAGWTGPHTASPWARPPTCAGLGPRHGPSTSSLTGLGVLTSLGILTSLGVLTSLGC